MFGIQQKKNKILLVYLFKHKLLTKYFGWKICKFRMLSRCPPLSFGQAETKWAEWMISIADSASENNKPNVKHKVKTKQMKLRQREKCIALTKQLCWTFDRTQWTFFQLHILKLLFQWVLRPFLFMFVNAAYHRSIYLFVFLCLFVFSCYFQLL